MATEPLATATGGVLPHFIATVGLYVNTTVIPTWNVVRLRETTAWEEARIVIAELAEDKRFILSMHHTKVNAKEFQGSPGFSGQSLSTFFRDDWVVAGFSESEHVIHWHGSSKDIEYRVLFSNELEARRFLRVFLAGCARIDELAVRDKYLLNCLDRPLLEKAMEGLPNGGEGAHGEGHGFR